MATLAMFHGIFIGMKPEKNVRHHRPHVHARYQGKEATFDIETREIIAGADTFPRDQRHMVQSFIALHEADLLANWESINSENGRYYPIVGGIEL